MSSEKNKECALRLKNIVKVYGTGENAVKALKGVSLDFRKSEFVSVLGPSGCGKTTMLNIIGGLDRYTEGDLIINGVTTKKYKDGDWDTYRNNSIGFVFQTYNLIPHQTVLSNVELALTLSGVSNKERKERAKKVLKEVGLSGLEHKRPNQLSGGQMQRVAIARALINDPEIILADEPTGALDTETSIQIMELLKIVARNRLVIMVTHNPALAEKYSTRIINLLDGEVVSDSDPFDAEKEREKSEKTTKKSAMSFLTALLLSLSNLRTKKGRTVLTAIAGSIGIIGIALVLAVSTGFSAYVNKLQADTLSVYPVTVSEATIDLSDCNKLTQKTITDEMLARRVTEKVYTRERFAKLTNMIKSNKLSKDYVTKNGEHINYLDYVKDYVDAENEKAAGTKAKWRYCVQEEYGFDMNDYIFADLAVRLSAYEESEPSKNVMSIDTLVQGIEKLFDGAMKNSNMNISAEFVREYIPTIAEIPDNRNLIESQYEKICGDWATEADELMLVVDKYNSISDITLALLGFRSVKGINPDTYEVTFGGDEEISFDDILNTRFWFIDDSARYVKDTSAENEYTYKYGGLMNTGVWQRNGLNAIPAENKIVLKVKGILRLKEDVNQGVLDTGIVYSSKLKDRIVEMNESSPIAQDALAGHEETDAITGEVSIVNTVTVKTAGSADTVKTARQLAASKEVSKISVYSVDYSAKQDLIAYLDAWNTDVVWYDQTLTGDELIAAQAEAKEAEVHYSDSTAMLFSALNMIVDAVKIVLICFTSISLVVSSIMIGIITYVSVVERTKEIGVLRAIGARKKDISRIFNAETFLIGLFAGLIGIIFTYLVSIPINILVGGLIEGNITLVVLKITDALILVAVSFVLTLIAGLVPSRIAAKKDPVVALRTE